MTELSTEHFPPSADARDSAVAAPATDPESTSTFHLIESAGGWTLTVRLTDTTREALIACGATPSTPAPSISVTVHVEPNLLPGHPFPANLLITGTPES